MDVTYINLPQLQRYCFIYLLLRDVDKECRCFRNTETSLKCSCLWILTLPSLAVQGLPRLQFWDVNFIRISFSFQKWQECLLLASVISKGLCAVSSSLTRAALLLPAGYFHNHGRVSFLGSKTWVCNHWRTSPYFTWFIWESVICAVPLHKCTLLVSREHLKVLFLSKRAPKKYMSVLNWKK